MDIKIKDFEGPWFVTHLVSKYQMDIMMSQFIRLNNI